MKTIHSIVFSIGLLLGSLTSISQACETVDLGNVYTNNCIDGNNILNLISNDSEGKFIYHGRCWGGRSNDSFYDNYSDARYRGLIQGQFALNFYGKLPFSRIYTNNCDANYRLLRRLATITNGKVYFEGGCTYACGNHVRPQDCRSIYRFNGNEYDSYLYGTLTIQDTRNNSCQENQPTNPNEPQQ